MDWFWLSMNDAALWLDPCRCGVLSGYPHREGGENVTMGVECSLALMKMIENKIRAMVVLVLVFI